MADDKSTSSRSGGALRAILLLATLIALVLGVFGAVYLDQFRGKAPPVIAATQPPAVAPPPAPVAPVAPTPQTAATTPAPEPAKPEANPSVAAPESKVAQAPTPTAPAVVASAPSPPASTVAKAFDHVEPVAAPPDAHDTARYWVEFGAYDGERYADALKQRLAALGIEATTTKAQGKGNRTYVRVRLTRDTDRVAAEQIARKAAEALKIAPLVHRSTAPASAPVAVAKPATKPAGNWVQFGAFRSRQGANTLAAKLVKSDIQAIVITTNNALYLVRVDGIADRAAAEKIATKGSLVLHSKDVLVGQARAGPVSKTR